MPAPPFTFQELIQQRAEDPTSRDRVAARMSEASMTYAELHRRSIAWGHLLRRRTPEGRDRPRVAVMMNNHLDFLLAYGGAAFAGAQIFLLNTGLGGDVLRAVLEQSGAETVLVDGAHEAELRRVAAGLAAVGEGGVIRAGEGGDVEAAVAALAAELGDAIDAPPPLEGVDAMTPWMVIYTSGTTGLPKGVVNSHGKVRGIGNAVASLTSLTPQDVGYVCMPLFHSNAVWLNWVPAMQAGASIVVRDGFSASAFVEDVLTTGATYWNYVGQPVHYVLEAIAAAHGRDEAAIRAAVRDDPRNRLRFCVGNGASGAERRRLVDWLGLEHVFEMYGSTESEISTFCLPGDPIDSVGQVFDPNVVVVGEDGGECPPLEVDDDGVPRNADVAVGEIVRRGTTGMFQGYHGMPEASAAKVRDGLYRSGDLGAIRVAGGQRHLYFFGRTDDWIRKDGENFSAAAVVDLVTGLDFVDRAAAYGVPHPISDEWVMVAITLRAGHAFDPDAFLAHCLAGVEAGRDAKWVPDLVRVVDDFEWTETHKIRVRDLKRVHYHPDHATRVFIRRRGAPTYRPLDRDGFDRLAAEFEATGRAHALRV